MRKNPNILLLKHSSVVFATFSKWHNSERSPINGNIDPLKNFLVPRVKKLTIIDQLHPGGEGVMPRIEVYLHRSMHYSIHRSSWYLYILKPFLELCNTNGTHILFKIRDFFSVIDWSLREKERIDYLIGLESINAIAGILLRRFGKVGQVIYYVSDYSPNRFKSQWFNTVYLALDRFCATHADFIWDVSRAMQPARLSVGLDPKKSAPVIHVPNGLYPDQIKTDPLSRVHKHTLVYMGTLGLENGPDVAIQALALVRKKFPDATLHVIGGTEKDVAELKKLTAKLHVSDAVIFYGMIPKNSDMSKIIRMCAIGLAPYRNFFGSPRLYADAGKIRAYCASGLPTVSSQVPPLGREVAEKGGAIVTNDDPKSFAKAICSIFEDEKLYKTLRAHAIKIAKYNTWDNSFDHAFRAMCKKT